MRTSGRRLTYANVVATLALFLVLAGGSVYAASKISGSQIKKNSLSGNRIKNHTVTGKKIKLSKLGTVPEAAHATNSDNVSTLKALSPVTRLTATSGASEAAARAAAPRTVLLQKGALTVYAKCFTDASINETFADVYGETTQAGSLLSGWDYLVGQNSGVGYLNPGTPESDRKLSRAQAATNDATQNSGGFSLIGADGTSLRGRAVASAKNGTPAAGNGMYGSGDVCLFGGFIAG